MKIPENLPTFYWQSDLDYFEDLIEFFKYDCRTKTVQSLENSEGIYMNIGTKWEKIENWFIAYDKNTDNINNDVFNFYTAYKKAVFQQQLEELLK